MVKIAKGLTVLAAASVMVLAACTGGGGPTTGGATQAASGGRLSGAITFQTWSLKNDRFTPYFENLIVDFNKLHPDVKVTWMDQPGDGYEEKILQQANNGNLPDVINLPPEFAYNLARVDQLADLKKADEKTLSGYVDGARKAYEFPGITGSFAYPWYLGTDLNFWNMDLLQQASVTEADLPKDIDGIFSLAIKVAQATGGKVKLISEVPRSGTLSNAGIPIVKDNKFVFNTPEAVALVEQYRKAYAAGAMPPEALNGNYLGNSALFKQGKVAWTTASAGFASELEKEAPSILARTQATPRIGNPPLFIQGISVSAKSANPSAALAFAQFVTNDHNQVEFLKLAQGFFPGTKESNGNPEAFTSVIKNPLQKSVTQKAAASIKDATPEYPIQFTYSMDTYLKQQLALCIGGEISCKEALDKAVEYANKGI